MACKCVPCSECRGTGTVWYSFSGRYLGNIHGDDLDTLEICEECEDGIIEICDECREREEYEWENS